MESIEATVGFPMSDSAATSYLNETYAACICINMDFEPWSELADACWSF